MRKFAKRFLGFIMYADTSGDYWTYSKSWDGPSSPARKELARAVKSIRRTKNIGIAAFLARSLYYRSYPYLWNRGNYPGDEGFVEEYNLNHYAKEFEEMLRQELYPTVDIEEAIQQLKGRNGDFSAQIAELQRRCRPVDNK